MIDGESAVPEPVVLDWPAADCEAAFLGLRSWPHRLWLDSARADTRLGRYSFVAADPIATFTAEVGDASAIERLRQALASVASQPMPGLPPFQGGWAGLLSYDLGRVLEPHPPPRFDEFRLPAVQLGLYDTVVAVDHHTGRGWIIAQGWPHAGARRRDQAARRAQAVLQQISQPPPEPKPGGAGQGARLPIQKLAPQHDVGRLPGLTSTFSAEGYRTMVERAIEYVHAGDVFQVNLAQRLLAPRTSDAETLYRRLRQCNPAPFAGFFDWGAGQILSASPERFLQLADRWVETRPIKGTRTRTGWPEADLFRADELRTNPKDRAENVMIVDLLRNDLARVCTAESVRVESLCQLETYAYVQHLVSEVRGQLAPGHDVTDLLAATFPGGSITGAPKPRALAIISELEPTARGAYCGALGYITPDGRMDTNILIRTMTLKDGWIQIPVGGGIVAESRSGDEYQETWHKAEGMLRALAPEAPRDGKACEP